VLTGACRHGHGGLIVLTSRFPFADLEGFDGSSARMLEVPAFTPAEGADLLAAAGGDWLPLDQRQDLVRAVDGHALATSVLAGLLAEHLPADELTVLRAGFSEAARTDARVSKVLGFYADRLTEADRYLLAAVSLFARPVDARAVLAVAGYEAFGSRLVSWTPVTVEAAVRGRLAGLASWHPDGTISAHPLIRDTFRPLVMAAAEIAADIALAAIPAGTVTIRADAQRVVEVIELLVDAGQWQAADDVYVNRCDGGAVWKHLPASWLGQRAAAAFVATPRRRAACAAQLDDVSLGFYLNEVGLFAMNAGDLVTAEEFMSLAIRGYRDSGDTKNLTVTLTNLAECLSHLGHLGPAQDAAAEALAYAESFDDWSEIRTAQSYLGMVTALAGDTVKAEQWFLSADQIDVSESTGDNHLYSTRGIWWADHLALTGRQDPARALTRGNSDFCRGYGWNEDVALCDLLLGRLALATGDSATAGERLAAAAALFRDGDHTLDLVTALVGLAEYARVSGDLDGAERHAAEAITTAAPRGLVRSQCAALAARARIYATRVTAGEPDLLYSGRDAADAASRLAVRHQIPWQELDALRAHALLDQAEGIDHGWAAKADALHARLVPPGLDPDPLGTVERLVAEQEATEENED